MFTPVALQVKKPVNKKKFLAFGKISVVLGYCAIVLGLLVVLGTTGMLQNGFSDQQAVLYETSTSSTALHDPSMTNQDPLVDSGSLGSTSSTSNFTASGSTSSTTDDVGTKTETTGTIKPTEALVPMVEFSQLPTLPVVDRDIRITLILTNAHAPRLMLIGAGQNYNMEVKGSKISDNEFIYLLPTKSIPAGKYFLRAYVLTAGTDAKSSFDSRDFTVEHQSVLSPDESISLTASTTEDIVVKEPMPIEPVATTSKIIEPPTYEVELTVESITQNPRYLKVMAKTNNRFDQIEFFLRNAAAVQRTYLGVGAKVDGGYVYWIDTTLVPAGAYIVILQGRVDAKIVYTKTSNKFDVIAPKLPAPITQNEISEITNELQKSDTEPESVDYIALRKSYATTPDTIKAPENINAAPQVLTPAETLQQKIQAEDPIAVDRARALMQERNTALNDLLLKHASSLQTNDATVKRLSKDALDKEVSDLANSAGTSEEDRAEIERLVTIKIESIKLKVEATENIIKARTNNKSARDSDLDGISDYDEVTIYKTNPYDADTDGDGVIDSVEIMLGYDPNNAAAEAVINYGSPKEFGYVNEAVLKVENVMPIVRHTNEATEPTVISEIRGYGIPNSFVTLYIFSTPTVVTVKTNSDGSFAYTFEKELEDGAHEVYVALTDNTGDIVVKSNPFSFTKTAQAFTYEDGLESNALLAPTPLLPSEVSKTFIVTLAMSVVALGFVLVLLGHVLRTRREDEEIIT